MDAIEHLQDEARKMGGDALIDLAQGMPKGEPMPEGGWFIFRRHRRDMEYKGYRLE